MQQHANEPLERQRDRMWILVVKQDIPVRNTLQDKANLLAISSQAEDAHLLYDFRCAQLVNELLENINIQFSRH
jgi:hypothetical protein